MATDRRTAPRFVVWFPVALDGEGQDGGVAVAQDVSSSGMLMASADELIVGAEVTVTFRVVPVDGELREVRGTIVRLLKNAGDPAGPWPHKVAVEFDEPLPDLEPVLHAATVRK
jgi:hypothetical protein